MHLVVWYAETVMQYASGFDSPTTTTRKGAYAPTLRHRGIAFYSGTLSIIKVSEEKGVCGNESRCLCVGIVCAKYG